MNGQHRSVILRMLAALAAVPMLLTTCGCGLGGPAAIVYINSYHVGYPSSDDILAGIRGTLSGSRVHLTTFYMDTKRHPEAAADKAAQARAVIGEVRPRVIIASDDAAVKYVVAEHFKDGPIPCVFCGVNWSCEPYGLPTPYVTGMLEILPVRQTIDTLRRYYPDARRLVVLSENTASEQKNKTALAPVFAELGLDTEYVLVDTYEQWRTQFQQANRTADLVFLPTNGAIRGWDQADAAAFVRAHIRVPVFTCDDFMMPYAVFGLTKVAREQGEWAARAALDILHGKRPDRIPLARNTRTQAWINPALAERVAFHPTDQLQTTSRRVE